jgi:general secretion pathway protein D
MAGWVMRKSESEWWVNRMRKKIIHKMARGISGWVIVSFIGSGIPAVAQMPPPPGVPEPPRPGAPSTFTPRSEGAAPAAERTATGQELYSLKYVDAPLDQILQFYSDLTGRTMIKSPGINATITLRGQTKLTRDEALEAITAVLAMNNVTLVPMGKKFFKVVQPTAARQEGMPISTEVPEKGFSDNDALISQVVSLKYIEIADAQTVIQGMLHGYGKIQPFERINSLLITDTAANLQRIMEVLELIDQPTELKVETRIYELKYAEAAKIAGRLNELISDSQAKEEKPRVAAPAAPVPAAPPGVIRGRVPAAAPESPEAAVEAALAEKGIIQGKVKIIADDRMNILIVISRPSNFIFFNKIVDALDRPVDPEVIVRVVAMEYADAEQVAGILNEFIGAAKAETPAAAARAGEAGGAPGAEGQAAQARALEDFVRQRAAAESRVAQAVGPEQAAKIGQLSANTKILADKRTNSLLLMGPKGDIAALEGVIDKLDIMLAQVLIEAVILEVNLSRGVQYGVDWLQRSMVTYNSSTKGPNGGVTVRDPVAAYGGAWSANTKTFRDGATVDRSLDLSGGLSYFLTLYDLNIDAVIRMAANSGDARVLSTPVILTTDNTEASINSSEQRPVVTQTATTEGGQIRSSYEYRDIGIKLKVKPRINPARYVVLDVTQTADTPGEEVQIDNNSVPRIFKRELQASIAVPSRSTVVLGGLVQSDHKQSRTKVPILGDIPILGTLFRSDDRSQTRTELLVLITPYVLMTPDEARQETERLHKYSMTSKENWQRGWSDSPLADLSAAQKKQMREAEEEAEKLRKAREQKLRSEAVEESEISMPRVINDTNLPAYGVVTLQEVTNAVPEAPVVFPATPVTNEVENVDSPVPLE